MYVNYRGSFSKSWFDDDLRVVPRKLLFALIRSAKRLKMFVPKFRLVLLRLDERRNMTLLLSPVSSDTPPILLQFNWSMEAEGIGVVLVLLVVVVDEDVIDSRSQIQRNLWHWWHKSALSNWNIIGNNEMLITLLFNFFYIYV